jgi:hypothetical protein
LVVVPALSLGVVVAGFIDLEWFSHVIDHCDGVLTPGSVPGGGAFCAPSSGRPSGLAVLVALAVPAVFGLCGAVGLLRGVGAVGRAKRGIDPARRGQAALAIAVGLLGALASAGYGLLLLFFYALSSM